MSTSSASLPGYSAIGQGFTYGCAVLVCLGFVLNSLCTNRAHAESPSESIQIGTFLDREHVFGKELVYDLVKEKVSNVVRVLTTDATLGDQV